MRHFRDWPIKQKLTWTILLASGLTVLVACLTTAGYEFIVSRKAAVRELSTLAEIIGANSRAALAFNDPEAARTTLAGISERPEIVAAVIRDRSGKTFAQYPAGRKVLPLPVEVDQFLGGHLELTRPIVYEGETLGTISLRSNLRAYYDRLRIGAIIVGLVLLMSGLLAWVLSFQLQKIVSNPIQSLARVAQGVTEQKNYSLRAQGEGKDEIGMLVGAFNLMLGQIAEDLTARQLLEKQVLEVGDREQSRIGQDLHDDLCQQLAGIALAASVLEEKLQERSLSESADAGEISTLINSAIQQARQIAHGLYPVKLEAEGLAAALAELTGRINASGRLVCRLDSAEEVLLRHEADAIHLYRIAQEAVNNALKHASAKEIVIGLRAARDEIVLTVRDDGIGFPEKLQRGLGLHTMQYRADIIGGRLEIIPAPAGGTIIRCTFHQQE